MSSSRAAPSLALAAYAETWISGAKVVVFGDSLSPLPERLLERGARMVQVYDRDPARAAEAAALNQGRQISYAPLENAGSLVRDGAFDFGIVEELGAESRGDALPPAAQPLAALRRALGRRGMALIAARNPEVQRSLIPGSTAPEDALGYYDLYELVSQHFEEVRMLGQTAFVGYAVADFGAAEDSDVRLDTAFLPGGAEEPEWFLALVSTLPVTSEAFSVIQIPISDLPLPVATTDREEPERLERALEALQAELSKREQWLKSLEARASTADQRADDAQTELEQLTQREAAAIERQKQLEQQLQEAARAKRALEERQAESQREFEELRRGSGTNARNYSELERRAIALSTQLDELGAQLQKTEGRAREAERQLQDGERKLQEAERQRQETERKLLDASRKLQEAERQRQDAERQRQEAERQAREATQQLQGAERQLHSLQAAADEESGAELRELEAQLVERGKEVARLDRELAQTERFGRQLIAQLEEAKAASGGLPGSATESGEASSRELDRLARRNAELEADLEAARWTISSLGANVVAAAGTAQPRRSAD
jgi:hypothetical protein